MTGSGDGLVSSSNVNGPLLPRGAVLATGATTWSGPVYVTAGSSSQDSAWGIVFGTNNTLGITGPVVPTNNASAATQLTKVGTSTLTTNIVGLTGELLVAVGGYTGSGAMGYNSVVVNPTSTLNINTVGTLFNAATVCRF